MPIYNALASRLKVAFGTIVRQTRIALLALFAVGLVLSLYLNSCSIRPGNSLQPLRIGFNNWPGFDILLYAQASGLFEQRGLSLELVQFDNSQDSARAMMRGNVDAALITLWDALQVDSGDDQPVFVLVTDVSHGADGIVAQPGIETIADLKDKQIAAKLGTVNHLILLEALQHHGLQPEAVTIKDVSNEGAAELMRAGAVDSAVVWEPILSNTAEAIGGNVIYTTREIDSIVIDGLVSRTTAIAAKQAELTQFMLVWFDLLQVIETNPSLVFEYVSEQLGISSEVFASGFSGLQLGTIDLNQQMFAQGRLQEAMRQMVRLLKTDLRHGRVIRNDVEINAAPITAAIDAWDA